MSQETVLWGSFDTGVAEGGVFASGCQYIVFPHRWAGNGTVTQMQIDKVFLLKDDHIARDNPAHFP